MMRTWYIYIAEHKQSCQKNYPVYLLNLNCVNNNIKHMYPTNYVFNCAVNITTRNCFNIIIST